MKKMILYTALLLCSACLCAWWAAGHETVDRAAFAMLPDDMPVFFKKGADSIVYYSNEPDKWTDIKPSTLRDTEKPEHYFDIELLRGKDVPVSRREFIKLCRELRVFPDQVGRLPYAIDEYYQRLRMAFAEYRTWPKNKDIQNKILYLAGVLSHYTVDAAQPLHCTVHFDGKLDENGQSPKSGIHQRIDGLFNRLKGAESVIEVSRKAEAAENVFSFTLGAIRGSNSMVDRVYELEKLFPPAEGEVKVRLHPDVIAFAQERLKAGALLTATVWYSAWKHSEKIEVPSWYTE